MPGLNEVERRLDRLVINGEEFVLRDAEWKIDIERDHMEFRGREPKPIQELITITIDGDVFAWANDDVEQILTNE